VLLKFGLYSVINMLFFCTPFITSYT